MPLMATSSDTDSHTRSPFLTRDGASMQPTFWRPPHRAFSLVSTVWPCLAVFWLCFANVWLTHNPMITPLCFIYFQQPFRRPPRRVTSVILVFSPSTSRHP
ncbi:hypothetical protein AAZX31_14G077400 [Glycine max]